MAVSPHIFLNLRDYFFMEASKVRQTFLDFFKSKGHHIVPSAPMVNAAVLPVPDWACAIISRFLSIGTIALHCIGLGFSNP